MRAWVSVHIPWGCVCMYAFMFFSFFLFCLSFFVFHFYAFLSKLWLFVSFKTSFDIHNINKSFDFLIEALCVPSTKLHLSFQGKFPPFYQYTKNFNSDSFDYNVLKDSEHVFMRWKEHFLVPDHTVKDINGASFAGFYYICFQKSTATIDGYYYHRTSEW